MPMPPGIANQAAFGKYLKREALKSVTDQQSRCFVKFDMHGRLTASQTVVIHARHVVVHQ